jgi:hypothetical protein
MLGEQKNTGQINSVRPACRKSLPRGRLFHINEVKWSRVRKMMEKEKMERGVVELVDTESLVPQEHLLVFYRKSPPV